MSAIKLLIFIQGTRTFVSILQTFLPIFVGQTRVKKTKAKEKMLFIFPEHAKITMETENFTFFFIFFKIISRDKNHVWDKFLFRLITANDVIAADGYEMNFSPQSSFFI